MRRLVTLALALGLGALVAVAAVDALRGSPEPRAADAKPAATRPERPPSPADWVEDGPAIAASLARLGVTGTLYLSADGCLSGADEPLRAVRLPDLTLSEGPAAGSCAFSLSSDARHSAGRDAVWSPAGPVSPPRRARASCCSTPTPEPSGSFRAGRRRSGPTAPSPFDGAAIVTWTNDCEGATETVSPSFSLVRGELGPYCRRVAVGREALDDGLPKKSRLRRVVSQAWTGEGSMTALLDTTTGARIATYEDGRAVTVSPFDSPLGPMRAQPGGINVGVLDRLSLLVYDIQPLPLFGTSLATLAYDWSPRGDWLAYATNEAVYLVRTSDWTAHVRLRVSTQGLAWR